VEVVPTGVHSIGPCRQAQGGATAVTHTSLYGAQQQGLGEMHSIWARDCPHTPPDACIVSAEFCSPRYEPLLAFYLSQGHSKRAAPGLGTLPRH
jgi:hypothetical protein